MMTDMDAMKTRLDELEVRLTFQQETVDSLSDMVTRQWSEIDRIHKTLGLLRDRVAEMEDNQPPPTNQRPPHY